MDASDVNLRPGVSRARPGATAADLMLEASRLFQAGRLDELRHLYHPEARLIPSNAGDAPLTPDEMIAHLRASVDDWLYHVVIEPAAESVDRHAAIMRGSVRYRDGDGGHVLASRVWLHTVRDGLIYRAGTFASDDEALEHYRRHGITLGIPA